MSNRIVKYNTYVIVYLETNYVEKFWATKDFLLNEYYFE